MKGLIFMAKKIYISPSNQSANAYATGGTNEKEQCHKIAKACVEYLKKSGFDVKCTYNDDMYARVKESNAFGADMHVAVHTNATDKHKVTGGTQILLYSLDGERKKAGQAVYDRLAPLTPGKSAEKLIAKPGFYECNSADGLTVYVEAEFHDTKEGSDFIIKNTKAIGEAIAKGICDYYGVKVTETPKKADDDTLYCVQVGAFSKYENAQKQLEKLKKAGFDGYITTKKK
jgi:N-acetylmuramoyl-L-alanine amidase